MSDREIIRGLAKTYAEEAAKDIQKENAQLYYAINRRKPIRPVVLINEVPWNQLAEQEELKLLCTGEKERMVERYFRRQLYQWNHYACDMILENYFPWQRHITIGSMGIDIKEDILEIDKGNTIVSHGYKDQLKNEEDIEKLHVPEVTVDNEADERDRNWLESLIGDILPVRMKGYSDICFFEPWDTIAQLRGVEPLLWDLIDRPEFSHALMEKLLQIQFGLTDKIEEMGLIDDYGSYIHCSTGLCDELPGELKDGKMRRQNIWGRGAAQIFASVSPAMTEEFEIEYAARYFKDYGLLYYGCCEPLDKKIDIVKKLPNLRKISVSPWANVDNAADQIGCDYVMTVKPNPAFVATSSLNEDLIASDIRHALEASRRNHTTVEFTLKDVSSVNHHPENLDRWAKIVMPIVRDFVY